MVSFLVHFSTKSQNLLLFSFFASNLTAICSIKQLLFIIFEQALFDRQCSDDTHNKPHRYQVDNYVERPSVIDKQPVNMAITLEFLGTFNNVVIVNKKQHSLLMKRAFAYFRDSL